MADSPPGSQPPLVTLGLPGSARPSRLDPASFLYCWLTKESDPDDIVINLQETYTFASISDVAREFDDAILVPELIAHVLRQVNPSPLVRRLKHASSCTMGRF